MSEDVSAGNEAENVVKAEPRKIKFNQSKMTLGDLEEFEDITGQSFNSAMKEVVVMDPETGRPKRNPDPEAKGRALTQTEMSMKGLVALVYMATKKDDPTFTLEDARALKLSEFNFDMSEDEETKGAPLGEAEGESPSA